MVSTTFLLRILDSVRSDECISVTNITMISVIFFLVSVEVIESSWCILEIKIPSGFLKMQGKTKKY